MSDTDPRDTATLRSSCNELLDQLQYTSDEVGALRSVISRVPEELLSLKPEDNHSIKAILGHITLRDREMANVLSSGIDQPQTDEPKVWEEVPTDELLSELQINRKAFVDDLRVIADRADDEVLALLDERLKRIVEQDVDAFREVAMRLHSAGIGGASA